MKQKTPEIGMQTRAQIAETLPKAIERAITSYHVFTGREASSDESKDFQNQHAAAKAALAHIELLIKLAALLNDENSDEAISVSNIIADAMRELKQGKDHA